MNRPYLSIFVVAGLAAITTLTGCDWSSGSQENFNTANQSALTNVSGFYKGLLGGGRAVATTSNGSILSLNIQQSGNRVEILDNQGSNYVGSVGSPVLTALPRADIPAGAVVSTYQISFAGKDGVSARDIEFTGTITLVAVTDIRGNQSSTDRDRVNGTEQETVEVVNESSGVAPNDQTRTTTTTTTNNDTTTSNSGSSTEYSLTDASTQLRLRGTWVEVGGKVSSVDALAAGIQGNFTAPAAP
jgi:hypothetical protein